MRALILLSMAGATCALADDIAGRWSGMIVPEPGDRFVPMALELRRSGDRLIGVMLIKDGDVCLLLDGKTDGRKATFGIHIRDEQASFVVIADGDTLSGQAHQRKDDKDAAAARVTASRDSVTDAGPLAGVWNGNLALGDSSTRIRLHLRQSGDRLSGSLAAGRHEGALEDVRFENGRLEFSVEDARFDLMLSGDQLEGQGVRGTDGKDVAKFTAVRQPAIAATGATGRWATSVLVSENGLPQRLPGSFELTQAGSELSGTVTRDSARSNSFTGGKVSGRNVTFTIATGRESLRFDLILEGDEMTGHAIETRDGRETKYEIQAVRRME